MVLPKDVEQATILAREWAEQDMDNWTRANAVVYATELLVIEKKTPAGIPIQDAIETQILYLLNNLRGWHGPCAKEAKRVLNEYLRKLKVN